MNGTTDRKKKEKQWAKNKQKQKRKMEKGKKELTRQRKKRSIVRMLYFHIMSLKASKYCNHKHLNARASLECINRHTLVAMSTKRTVCAFHSQTLKPT